MDHQPEQRQHEPTVAGRRQDRSGKEQVVVILRLALILGMVSAYAVGFSPLYRLTGSGMWAALAIFPVIAAAWFWGLRPALLAASLCSLLSGLLVSLVQSSHWGVVGQALLVSLAVYLPAGAVVGRLHDLGERLRDQISERKRAEQVLLKRTHDLGERVKELTCLYGMGKLMQRPGMSLAEILRGTIELMPSAWQYPEVTCARVDLAGQEFRTANYEEAIWKQTSDIIVHGKPVGTVEICYLEERLESDEGPFLKEERWLVDAIAERLGRIAERKRDEEAIRIRDGAMRSSISAIAFADLEGSLTYVNPAFLEMWGYDSEEQVLGKPVLAFWRDEEKAAKVARALGDKGHWIGELTGERRDGSGLDVQLAASMVEDEAGKPICMMASFADVTERKRAEEALRESEVKWRTLALTAPAVILTIDRDGMIQFLNRAVGEYTPEQAVGTSAYDYVSPDQRETMRRSIEQVLETGQPGSYEILGAGPRGPDTAWYETHLGPVLYNDQVTAVTLVSTDITQRKWAEEALRESEEKYRNVVERANDGILIIQEAVVRYANPRLAEMWGATLQELIGTPFADHVHPDELPKVVDRYKRRVAGEDVAPIYETILSRNDGTRLYVELNAGIITYQGNPADLVIVRDITERKRAEKELAKTVSNLRRFNRLAVGREKRMIALKREVNDLLRSMGRQEEYTIRALEDVESEGG